MEEVGLQSSHGSRQWRQLSINISLVAVVLSLLFHVVSVVSLSGIKKAPTIKNPIKVRLVDQKAKPAADVAPSDTPDRKLIETPLAKTERPKESSHAGATDHQTERETKVARVMLQERAKDAGQKGKPDAGGKTIQKEQRMTKTQSRSKSLQNAQGKIPVRVTDGSKSAYEALLPLTPSDVAGQVNAGYQEYIDENLEVGERIDLNTTEYRYIGYFSSLRKSIELVWNYPLEAARRGMQGEVDVEFAINKDGRATRIRVVKSSGYPILDDAIVEAIRLASPFAPLPKGLNKERLVIVGAFHYVLAAH